jgi:hypothetical protein
MGGKHAAKKYKVKREGDRYLVVFSGSNERVAGTPTYEAKKDAQSHVDLLNG